jgi:hypothetical protein
MALSIYETCSDSQLPPKSGGSCVSIALFNAFVRFCKELKNESITLFVHCFFVPLRL